MIQTLSLLFILLVALAIGFSIFRRRKARLEESRNYALAHWAVSIEGMATTPSDIYPLFDDEALPLIFDGVTEEELENEAASYAAFLAFAHADDLEPTAVIVTTLHTQGKNNMRTFRFVPNYEHGSLTGVALAA